MGAKSRTGAALMSVALLVAGQGWLLAQEAAETFTVPEDVILTWAKRSGLVLMSVSVLVVLFVLILRRRRVMEAQSKWLLFVGLCVLPVPVTFLSAGVGMESSKEVEFCASCHRPMGPFVADMKDLASKNLAAVHYKNCFIQSAHCWTCHSDYGIAGTMQAKLKGLHHITAVAFDTWEAPIQAQQPYQWRICLGCHGNSALFKAPRENDSAHEGVIKEVLAGETACTDCHESAHPPREKRGSK